MMRSVLAAQGAVALLTGSLILAPTAAADVPGLDPFIGQWGAHEELLTINPDGSGTETYSGGWVNFQITGVQPPPPQPDHTAYGYITSGGQAEPGSYVAITLVDGGQGALVSIANGDNNFPFCKIVDGSYLNNADCGA